MIVIRRSKASVISNCMFHFFFSLFKKFRLGEMRFAIAWDRFTHAQKLEPERACFMFQLYFHRTCSAFLFTFSTNELKFHVPQMSLAAERPPTDFLYGFLKASVCFLVKVLQSYLIGGAVCGLNSTFKENSPRDGRSQPSLVTYNCENSSIEMARETC